MSLANGYFIKTRLIILIGLVCSVLTIVACGGGGGGSGSPGIANTGGTFYGQITASSLLLQRKNTSDRQIRPNTNSVSRALVWLENFPDRTAITDENGYFTLTNVPLNTGHRIIARYDIAVSGEVYLARSEIFTLDSGNPVKQIDKINLEKGTSSFSGVLKDQLGSPVSDAILTLWGIRFRSNRNGEFSTPPLPPSADKEKLKIEAVGFRPIELDLPFLQSSDAFANIAITLSDLSEPNFSPVIFFNQLPTQVSPRQKVELSVDVIDPDELVSGQLKPDWSCSTGLIETTADPMTIYWTAPDTSGLATISAQVKDSRGAAGSASVAIAVGGVNTTVLRIDSVQPSSAAVGEKIYIIGSGFGKDKSLVQVSFNGIAALIDSCTDNEIITSVPKGTSSGILFITTPSGEKSAGIFTVADGGFSINPAFGPPGTLVTISAANLGDEQGNNQVYLNGATATVQAWSDDSISFYVPDGSSGGVVSLLLNQKEKTTGVFKVTRIFNLSTNRCTFGTILTLSGEGFGNEQGGSQIIFNSTLNAPVQSWSDGKILFSVPDGAKSGDLGAIIQGIEFNIASMTINGISQISPNKAISGDILTITGTGFGANQNGNYVAIGENRLQITDWSDGEIKGTIASGTRPGNVVVNVNGLNSNPMSLNVTEINAISHQRKPAGASLTISGYGFGKDSGYVFFGDAVTSQFKLWQDDKIEVIVPENATGTAPIKVSTMGIRTRSIPFAVTWFESLNYIEGWPGREIVVSGNNFGDCSDPDQITFNDQKASIISWTNAEIRVRVPYKGTTGPLVLSISSWPIVLCDEFRIYNNYEYIQLSPDLSGPRANSRPLLPGVGKDALGNIFASDFDNGWVWKFTSDGTQSKFGNLQNPWGLAVSPLTGFVFVSESANDCIKIYDPDGNFIATIGSSGNGNAEFSTPRGLCFDKNANLYVADSGNDRIQVFSAANSYGYLTEFGSYGTANGQFISPSGIVVGDDFTIYVADSDNHRVQRFLPNDPVNPTSWSFAGWLGSKDPNADTPGWHFLGNSLASTRDGGFRNPYGVGLSGNDLLLVADTNNNRIQVIDALNGNFQNHIGVSGITQGQYNQPLAIADAGEYVVIADSSNARLQKSTVDGAYIGQLIPDTSELNTNPWRIAVDSANRQVYILDRDDGSITVLNIEGEVQKILGSRGTGREQFYQPKGIALDQNGNLFVADSGNARIQEISPEGNFVRFWGAYGNGPGQFIDPNALAVSKDGQFIFIVDSGLNRVQKFTRDGTFVKAWGSFGAGDDNFNHPSGIAIDSENHVYISDQNNHRIKKYTSGGELLGWWGSYDAGAQAFWLDPGSNRTGAVSDADGGFDTPTDIAIDSEDNVFVTDSGNFRIQRFSSDQANNPDAGFQTEIYVGLNLAALTVDRWATVYTINQEKTILRFAPDI